MRIGLVTPWSLEDPGAWSGVLQPLRAHLRDVADVADLSTVGEVAWPDRALARGLGMVSARGYLCDFGVATAWTRGRRLRRRLAAEPVDVVLAVAASSDIAFLQVRGVPVVQVTDGTFAQLRGFYPMFASQHPLSSLQAESVTTRAIRATTRFVASSEWAIESLVGGYGVPREACTLAPMGAGIETVAPDQMMSSREARWSARREGALKVLMVSSDWERKGGEQVLAAVSSARARGLDVHLTVVGNGPSTMPDWATNLGRRSATEVSDIYQGSDVLLELAVANAAGVTLTDAAAHGLPVVATRVGGVDSIVRDSTTGVLVEPGPDLAGRAADALVRVADARTLVRMSREARTWYEHGLAWDHWAQAAVAACENAVEDVGGLVAR